MAYLSQYRHEGIIVSHAFCKISVSLNRYTPSFDEPAHERLLAEIQPITSLHKHSLSNKDSSWTTSDVLVRE
jgi:hypothetical protein